MAAWHEVLISGCESFCPQHHLVIFIEPGIWESPPHLGREGIKQKWMKDGSGYGRSQHIVTEPKKEKRERENLREGMINSAKTLGRQKKVTTDYYKAFSGGILLSSVFFKRKSRQEHSISEAVGWLQSVGNQPCLQEPGWPLLIFSLGTGFAGAHPQKPLDSSQEITRSFPNKGNTDWAKGILIRCHYWTAQRAGELKSTVSQSYWLLI